MKQYKPFLTSIIIEILIITIFLFNKNSGYENEILFGNHIIERILIALILPIIGLIRNSKEKNTNYLKKILIIVEIYILLLIFVQDGSNFSKREFSILYLCILGIIKEIIYKRFKKRQTIFFTSIYSIIVILIICIGCFMWYREPINYEKILDKQEYSLFTNITDELSNSTKITLSDGNITENINTNIGISTYHIKKNQEYELSFISPKTNKNNYIIIQDPFGNIVQIFPQSSIMFGTNNYQIQLRDTERKTNYYPINMEFPEHLNYLKINYNNTIKNTILSNLPNIFKENQKFQKISSSFTKFLAKVFPFRYKKNLIILEDYLPYFDIQSKTQYKSIENKYKYFKSNSDVIIKNTNLRNKYKNFFSKIFK